MSTLSTHVLDTSRGCPAADIPVTLTRLDPGTARSPLATAKTDADGRIRSFLPGDGRLEPGTYQLRFDTARYQAANRQPAFFPYVDVVFTIDQPGHHHVPLLLSPFGYSTYRGS